MNGTHTWGGHGLKDPGTGKWVGYFSYMAGHCDLRTWQSQSMIVSAVADAPDGAENFTLNPETPAPPLAQSAPPTPQPLILYLQPPTHPP